MKKDHVFTKMAQAKLMLLLSISTGSLVCPLAYADEGGTSFWLPGQYGSLAAVPAESGWSLPLVYYHNEADAGGSIEFVKGGDITLGLDVGMDLLLAVPTYVFKGLVWGGQASVSMAGLYGKAGVAVDATLTGPGGGILSDSEHESLTNVGDLYPSFSVRWNHGNHNSMTYTMLGVPVGSYNVDRLVNIGTNHWSADIGGGYTYFNPKSGREFSAVLGATYNFENPDTDYQNGIDMHLDLGISQFLSEQWHVGLVGYVFHQVTGDSGAGAQLGDFKSRVNGFGPQVGYIFNMGGKSAYLNLKSYFEFGAENRIEGCNGWITLSIPLGGGNK